jgi:hypothetical protein
MATLPKLVERGLVIEWETDLPQGKQPERCLFLPPLAERLPALLAANPESMWGVEDSPAQQLDALALAFVSGEPLVIEHQVKYLEYQKTTQGVWYLKAPDIRLFGWIACADHFIAASIGIANQVKRLALYHGFGNEVAYLRDQLPLDNPKFAPGDDPHGLISNLTYPS